MAGYIRQDTTNNIADGNVINASDFDNEYNAIEAAFHATTGHTHDGTSAEGAPITKIGPTQDVVASASALTPKTDNTIDLGSSTLEYKDLYIDGTANIDSLVADTADINAGTIDGVTIGGASAGAGTFTTVAATTGNITTVNSTTVDTTNIEVTNIKAKDGTASASIADSTGVMSLVANPVFSGGTANGVLYLDGSKVATSGSALTFDGTNLGLQVTPNAWSTTTSVFENPSGSIYSFSGTNQIGLNSNAYYNGTNWIYRNASSVGAADFYMQNGFFVWRTAVAGTSPNIIAYSEQMRLTSTGLGIGTSSPAYRLQLTNTVASNFVSVVSVNTGTAGLLLGDTDSATVGRVEYDNASNFMALYTNGSERMRLDSSGNLGLGVTPSAWVSNRRVLEIGGLSAASLALNGTAAVSEVFANATRDAGGTYRYFATAPASYVDFNNSTAGGWAWNIAPSGTAGNAISFTQAMTLDASGRLLVGITSGSYALDVGDVSGGNMFRFTRSGVELSSYISAGLPYLGTTSNTDLVLMTNNAERMRLDSSGNLGLGVTPSAWNSDFKAIQVGANGSIAGRVGTSNTFDVTSNGFRNTSGNWQYIATNPASRFTVDGSVGGFQWYTAPSGTAGNTISFTQAMTLNASGNLGIGLTNPAYRLDVEISAGPYVARFRNSSTSTSEYNVALFGQGAAGAAIGYIGTGGSAVGNAAFANNFVVGTQTSNALVFNTNDTERARITSGGNLLVGTTSDDARLTVYTTASIYGFFNSTNANGGYAAFGSSGTVHGDIGTAAQIVSGGANTDFGINARGSRNLILGTNNTERARITSGGNFKIGGTADRATTEGDKQLVLFDGTAPVGTLANGVSFYSASGEANVMDAAGNATLLSPHDAETNEWIFRSKHTPTGKVLKIDVERLLKFVNDHFGLDAVHEFIEP